MSTRADGTERPRWLWEGLVALSLLMGAGTGDHSRSGLPDDPLGVVDRLRAHSPDELVVWESCSLRGDFDKPAGLAVTSTVGVFDPADGVGWVGTYTRQHPAVDLTVNYDESLQAVGDGDQLRTRTLGINNKVFTKWSEPSEYETPPPPSPSALITLDGVLVELNLDGGDGVVERDPSTGQSFIRFESLPVRRTSDTVVSSSSAYLRLPDPRIVWVLDVWSDDDGRVERLRSMTADDPDRWTEIRFANAGNWWKAGVERCPQSVDDIHAPWIGTSGWEPSLVIPLDVSVDPDGRPYDVAIAPGTSIEQLPLTRFVVPDGELRVADGIAIGVGINGMEQGDFRSVNFPADNEAGTTTLDVSVIWETWESGGRQPLAVRADVGDQPVDHWGDFEDGYGTDGGMGGLVSQRLIDRAAELKWTMDTQPITVDTGPWLDDENLLVADLDGVDGNDMLVFSNGSGDGGFPMARGFNADGVLVSLVLWDTRYPWRLAIPDGTPPLAVREREQEFKECIAGQREVALDGSCPTEL